VFKKILIINPFGIGDVLFTTPIIHTLKDVFVQAKIGYLCNRRSAALVENNSYIDYLFLYDRDEFEALRKKSFFLWLKKAIGFLNEIKEKHFDLALDFSLNTQYGFFSWFCGIKERVGYDYKKRGIFLTKKIKLTGYDKKHIVEYYADLLALLGLKLGHKKLELYLKNEDVRRAEEMLKEAGITESDFLVGIIPGAGASWGEDAYLKHWPPENFALLSDKIIESRQAKIIILGNFLEKEIARTITKDMKEKAIDLSGMTTIGELAALLSKVKILITNDGGPLHMAVAQGVKTVSFFGPVDPKVYGPYPPDEKQHIVLRRNLECSPCYRNFRLAPCLKNKECLEGINVEDALGAVSALLT
jgi:3-deoxy-D-manno-octulosonic-acid transferase